MENYGVFIETFVARELLDLVVRDGEIKNKNIEICRNIIPGDSVFACGNDDENSSFSNIVIPKSIVCSISTLEDTYTMGFLNKEYGFDYEQYMLRNDLTFYQMVTLFSIFHEVGHIMTSEEDMAVYGKLVTFKEEEEIIEDMLTLMDNVENSSEEKEIMLSYRKLKSEVFADMMSIEFMNRYEKIACDIVREGVEECDKDTLTLRAKSCMERDIFVG